tara:strand:+ start:97 stop:441 length:345 start_codon:yes stop_codon:yes gene_type:complete
MNKTKLIYKIVLVGLIASSLNSVYAVAKNDKNRVIEATVEYKCHIELLGGTQTIDFVSVKEQNLNKLADALLGKAKLKPFTQTKLPIYKVYECAKLNDKFKRNQSNLIDEKTIR